LAAGVPRTHATGKLDDEALSCAANCKLPSCVRSGRPRNDARSIRILFRSRNRARVIGQKTRARARALNVQVRHVGRVKTDLSSRTRAPRIRATRSRVLIDSASYFNCSDAAARLLMRARQSLNFALLSLPPLSLSLSLSPSPCLSYSRADKNTSDRPAEPLDVAGA